MRFRALRSATRTTRAPDSATPTHMLRICVNPPSRRRRHTCFAYVSIPRLRRLPQKAGENFDRGENFKMHAKVPSPQAKSPCGKSAGRFKFNKICDYFFFLMMTTAATAIAAATTITTTTMTTAESLFSPESPVVSDVLSAVVADVCSVVVSVEADVAEEVVVSSLPPFHLA